MNWHNVGKYIATCAKPWETVRMKVHKLIPKRSSNAGRKITVSGKPLTQPPNSKQKLKDIWIPQRDSFTPEQQRYLLAAALEIGVKAAFELHVYSFGGEMFLQQSGGPTGKRATCPSARIRVNQWARRLRQILDKLKLDIPLICRRF